MNTENGKSSLRIGLSFSLAGIAIALRMASDWLFPSGGPLPYQLAQAFFLVVALLALMPYLNIVFLSGGNNRRGLREGLIAIPIGFLAGLGSVWLQAGTLHWPSIGLLMFPIANNILFTAIEELEFRGFLLAWLLRRGFSSRVSILLQAILHTLAHMHRLWQGDYISMIVTLIITVWFGSITHRTRSLWGAWAAHLFWNLAILIPELSAGLNIR